MEHYYIAAKVVKIDKVIIFIMYLVDDAKL